MTASDTTAPPSTDLPAAPGSGGEPELKKAAISPLQALLFGLTGVSFPLVLAGQGGTLSFSAGNGAWLAELISIGMAVLVAIVVVRFSRRHLTTGSLMSYLNLEIGPKSGLFTGVALFVGYAAGIMLLTSTALVFLVSLLSGFGINLTSTPLQVVLGLALVGFCVLLARRGVSMSVNSAIIMGWIAFPFVIVILVVAIAKDGIHLGPQLQMQQVTFPGFMQGLVLAFGTFVGFEGFTALARETANPRKVLPKLVMTLVLAMGAAALVSILITVPIMRHHAKEILAGESPLSVLAHTGGLNALGSISDFLLFIATVGALLVFINDAGRIVGTAARDGMLPTTLGHINEKTRTPSRAIILVAIVSGGGFAAYIGFTGQPIYTAFLAFAIGLSFAWSLAYIATGIAGVADGIRTRSLWFGLGAGLGCVAGVFLLGYTLVADGFTSAAIIPWSAVALVMVLWVVGVATGRAARNRTTKSL